MQMLTKLTSSCLCMTVIILPELISNLENVNNVGDSQCNFYGNS